MMRSHFIEYLVPAFSGDEIMVRTWVTDMKRVTSAAETLQHTKRLECDGGRHATANCVTHLILGVDFIPCGAHD